VNQDSTGHVRTSVGGAATTSLRARLGSLAEAGWPEEIRNMLRVGQIGSTAALIDIRKRRVKQWTRGVSQEPPLKDRDVFSLAELLFARDGMGKERIEAASAVVAESGGVRSLIVRRSDTDLFATLLPGTHVALMAVMRHRDRTPAGSDMSLRGRELAHALSSRHAQMHGGVLDEASRGHEVSLAFWQKMIGFFTRHGSDHAATNASEPLHPVRGSRWKGSLGEFCAGNPYALFAVLVDIADGSLLDAHEADGTGIRRHAVAPALVEAFSDRCDPWPLFEACGGGDPPGKLQIQIGKREFYWLSVPYYPSLSIPFDPDKVLLLYKRPRPGAQYDWHALDQAGLDFLRNRVKALLAGGLKTQIQPFPETQDDFRAIVEQLVELAPDDLVGRLDIGGFADHPVMVDDIQLRCKECIYFLPNRRWCDLPELPVPVEEDWFCRLWKI